MHWEMDNLKFHQPKICFLIKKLLFLLNRLKSANTKIPG